MKNKNVNSSDNSVEEIVDNIIDKINRGIKNLETINKKINDSMKKIEENANTRNNKQP